MLFLLLLSTAALTTANQLLSCADVDCPVKPDTAIADCRVANQSFSAVGVSSIRVPGEIFNADSDDNVELTWTVGVDEYPDGPGRRLIERVYYLGTPPGVNLTAEDGEVGGCAV